MFHDIFEGFCCPLAQPAGDALGQHCLKDCVIQPGDAGQSYKTLMADHLLTTLQEDFLVILRAWQANLLFQEALITFLEAYSVLGSMTLRFLEMFGDIAFLALFGASARAALPI